MTTADHADTIRNGLEEAGQRAADARLARAAALAEIGEWLRRDRAAGDPIGIVAAEGITGLSRPTLTAARDDDSGWRELRELARMVKAYGDDYGHQTKLHARLPWLGGWYAAANYLQDQHDKEYWKARGGFDPMADIFEGGWAPGYEALMRIYDAEINRLAGEQE